MKKYRRLFIFHSVATPFTVDVKCSGLCKTSSKYPSFHITQSSIQTLLSSQTCCLTLHIHFFSLSHTFSYSYHLHILFYSPTHTTSLVSFFSLLTTLLIIPCIPLISLFLPHIYWSYSFNQKKKKINPSFHCYTSANPCFTRHSEMGWTIHSRKYQLPGGPQLFFLSIFLEFQLFICLSKLLWSFIIIISICRGLILMCRYMYHVCYWYMYLYSV